MCYPVPRLEGQPCDNSDDSFKCNATATTGEPLTCDIMATKKCVKPQTLATTSQVFGAHCYAGRPCTAGLTCSTSDLKCYDFPVSRMSWFLCCDTSSSLSIFTLCSLADAQQAHMLPLVI